MPKRPPPSDALAPDLPRKLSRPTLPHPAPLPPPSSGPPTPASIASSAGGGPVLGPSIGTSVLQSYVGSLRNNLAEHNAVYEFEAVAPTALDGKDAGFRCTVTMPFNSPVRSAKSDGVSASKQVAKRSAAVNCVRALIEAGEISPGLLPTPANPSRKKGQPANAPKPLPLLPNLPRPKDPPPPGASGARVESSGNRTSASRVGMSSQNSEQMESASTASIMGESDYRYLSAPAFWAESPELTTRLCSAVMTLAFGHPHEEHSSECRPLLFLTSKPLPPLVPSALGPHPSLPLDVSIVNVPAQVKMTAGSVVVLDESDLDRAFEYTRRLFRAILNKPLDGELERTSYLIVPLKRGFKSKAGGVSNKDIDWDEVNLVDGELTLPFDVSNNDKLEKQLEDAVLAAPAEFGRRFYATKVRFDLSPDSPEPGKEGVTLFQAAMAKDKHEYRYRDITELSFPNQPIVEAEHSMGPKNGGVVGQVANRNRQAGRLLIPEMLEKHRVSASVLRSASILPAALSEVDDELLAAEMSQKFFDGKITTALAREALTCPAARPFPGQGPQHYERLEMLGDTILKLIATVGVYCSPERANEGSMTHQRHLLVCNKALHRTTIEAGIVPYIRKMVRRGRAFLPPRWIVEGSTGLAHVETAPSTQLLGDKTIADVAEALIAAAYLSNENSLQAALDATHVLKINVGVRRWDRLGAPPTLAQGKPLSLMGYQFRDPANGWIVMSHTPDPSRKAQFQRFEFLGDAVIDYLTVRRLWAENVSLGPAELTHMKHSRVANSAFSAFMVFSGLIDQLQHLDLPTTNVIRAFSASMTHAKLLADENIAAGNDDFEFWSEVPEHKWLGDTLEAVFGAIWEDSGFDMGVVTGLYEQHLRPFVEKYAVPPRAHSLHPKSVLLEFLASAQCRQWAIERRGGVDGPRGRTYSTVVVFHGKDVAKASAPGPELATRKACGAARKVLVDDGLLAQLCNCRTQVPINSTPQ